MKSTDENIAKNSEYSRTYYLDTSIWIDLYEDRKDKFRSLGEWAFEALRIIKEYKGVVLYSDLVLKELSGNYNKERFQCILEIILKQKFSEKIETNKEQIREAGRMCKKIGIPFGDCLHAVLARDNGAVMVTRDKHFLELTNIVEVKKPEDLI